jgi:hypothetical protein
MNGHIVRNDRHDVQIDKTALAGWRMKKASGVALACSWLDVLAIG